MERTLIDQLDKKVNQEVKIAGWVQTIRDQGKIKFIIIRDISGLIQAVFTEEAGGNEIFNSLNLESVVEIKGKIKEEKQAPQGIEIAAEKMKVLSYAYPELPIPVVEKSSEETGIQKRLDWRWVDLRKQPKVLIFKAWTAMERAMRKYWLDHGYLQIHSPKLMSTCSESGAELFEVEYFDRKAYLAQSPQFYKQMAMASGFEKIFEIGPLFRADPSFTSRHATEFTGFDSEISFIDSHEDVMSELEKVIAFMISQVNNLLGKEIAETCQRELAVPEVPFPRLNMEEAKKILSEMGVPSEKEGDLSPEEEKKLCQYIRKKKGHEFVFIVDYPVSARAFYHMRQEENPKLTKSFDLLWNGVEISTGAQREHRYEQLLAQAKEKGLELRPLQFYLNFFKYGCPPHGGYGLGPGRMVMKLMNLDNIREATYIYRGVKRLTP